MNSHALVGPLTNPGVAGLLRLISKLLVPLVLQSLVADTVMELVLKPAENVTVTVVSFTPNPFGCVMVVVPACAAQL
jgi:hypothetical protein